MAEDLLTVPATVPAEIPDMIDLIHDSQTSDEAPLSSLMPQGGQQPADQQPVEPPQEQSPQEQPPQEQPPQDQRPQDQRPQDAVPLQQVSREQNVGDNGQVGESVQAPAKPEAKDNDVIEFIKLDYGLTSVDPEKRGTPDAMRGFENEQ